MNDPTAVKGVRKATSANTQVNALSLFVDQKIRDTVNTAEIMAVGAASQNGHGGSPGEVSATPLVSQTDGNNKAVAPAKLSGLKPWRYQAGSSAFILDMQPGDKAIAIFTKRDSSGINPQTKNPVQPASNRIFDQADAVLLPSVDGQPPENWVMIEPESGRIEVSSKSANIIMECREGGDISITAAQGNVSIEALNDLTIKAGGTIYIEGNIQINGTMNGTGGAGGAALVTRGGMINEGGTIKSNDITLDTHIHEGTGQPVEGT